MTRGADADTGLVNEEKLKKTPGIFFIQEVPGVLLYKSVKTYFAVSIGFMLVM